MASIEELVECKKKILKNEATKEDVIKYELLLETTCIDNEILEDIIKNELKKAKI